MELESFFEFLETDDIRVKGTRVGIEIVIEDFLDGASPEEIAVRYPSLSLLQVYATLTFYLANQDKLDAYLEAGGRAIEKAVQVQDEQPPEVVKRLRQLKRTSVQVVRG